MINVNKCVATDTIMMMMDIMCRRSSGWRAWAESMSHLRWLDILLPKLLAGRIVFHDLGISGGLGIQVASIMCRSPATYMLFDLPPKIPRQKLGLGKYGIVTHFFVVRF